MKFQILPRNWDGTIAKPRTMAKNNMGAESLICKLSKRSVTEITLWRVPLDDRVQQPLFNCQAVKARRSSQPLHKTSVSRRVSAVTENVTGGM